MVAATARRRILRWAGGGFLAALFAPVFSREPAGATASRPVAAFASPDVPSAVQALYAGQELVASGDVSIDSVELAEDGSIVPVTLTSELPATTALALFADKNPVPLIGRYEFFAGTRARIATRVKLAETSTLTLVAETASGLFTATHTVRVTRGGCI